MARRLWLNAFLSVNDGESFAVFRETDDYFFGITENKQV